MVPDIDARLLAQLAHHCPATYRALAGRRFLLPRKYEGSFSSQDVSTQRRQLIILSWALGLVKDSLPARAELICLLQALRCGLPVVYLDPGLADALRDTDLPVDFSISDIGFPWPSVRLMVPKGLCLSANGRSGEVQYLDVAFCGQNEVVNLSEELASDLKKGLTRIGGNRSLDDHLTKGFVHPQAGQFHACALSYRQSGRENSAASYQPAAWSVQ
jgi:hypothetical protein